MKCDKILIVGGGSAGWMTAATLVRAFPDKDITVLESPNVPTINAGTLPFTQRPNNKCRNTSIHPTSQQ